MNLRDFYYELPPALIAQRPPERGAARMLYMERATGRVEHRRFSELKAFLRPGDCIVINDSKVIPARLYGTRLDGQSTVEMLLHERLDEYRWEALVKPGRKGRPGDILVFGGGALKAEVESVTEDGLRVVKLIYGGPFEEILEQIGETPLPHYIKQKPDASAKERYQTVYAREDGSVAAPTAGLHFTETILSDIRAAGVFVASITLHVGIGTFRPVRTDNILEHKMHSEYCDIQPRQADIINEAKQNGGRIIAIGTTSCRAVESFADGLLRPGKGRTDIFIYPGYRFKITDGLLTNFHLPESTLLMLVSAFAGRERALDAYRQAIDAGYMFYSYGDCCLFL